MRKAQQEVTMAQDINEKSFSSEITRIFSKNSLSSYLSMDTVSKFYALTVRMLEENEKYNLTAITDPSKIILNHYADCVAMAKNFKQGAKIIDVGCGAGFPTLPLAIVRPDLSIVAMDSTAKRINYVAETARMLGLSGVRAEVMRDHHNECERCAERGKLTRAETVHHENEVRKRPDMALTRWVDEPDGTRREVLHPLCNQCHNEVHGRVLSGNPPKPQLNAEKW